MVRPKKPRKVSFEPNATYFKPRAVPLTDLEEVELSIEEMEALRLCNLEEKSQGEVAEEMGVSQSTVGRNLKSARKKIATALVKGKAIKIEKAD